MSLCLNVVLFKYFIATSSHDIQSHLVNLILKKHSYSASIVYSIHAANRTACPNMCIILLVNTNIIFYVRIF